MLLTPNVFHTKRSKLTWTVTWRQSHVGFYTKNKKIIIIIWHVVKKKKKKAPPNIFVLSLSHSLVAIPLTVQAIDHPTRHSQRPWTASDQSSEEICSKTEIRPTPTTSVDSTWSSRTWVFDRISDSAGSLKPTLAEHGFSIGSQIRMSVGFRPNPVKDPIRPASERGERERVPICLRARERGRLCQSS